jgi:molybdenum cofactor synthesis domain-containing protein
MKVGILTISDRSSRGERKDLGGPLIKKIIEKMGGQVIDHQIVPDEEKMIADKLVDLSDEKNLDLVLTTGGTGFSPRDITPEATLKVIQRRAAGLEEAMRMEGYKKNKKAVLSRAVCGIRGKTLIINLPGGPKGIEEGLETLLPLLPHAVEVLRGEVKDCHDSSKAKEEE